PTFQASRPRWRCATPPRRARSSGELGLGTVGREAACANGTSFRTCASARPFESARRVRPRFVPVPNRGGVAMLEGVGEAAQALKRLSVALDARFEPARLIRARRA